jgi:hypothetical protein
MRVVTTTAKTNAVVLSLVVIGWAAPLRADSTYFPNQPGNAGDNTLEDIDFNSASIPTGASGVLFGKKYWVLNLATYDSKNACFSITTWGDPSADTRIYVYDSTINDYRSLNDDYGGTRQSTARVWISPPSSGGRYVSPVISGFSSNNNTMLFGVSVAKMNSATTETQCTVGSTYKAKASGNTFVNAT